MDIGGLTIGSFLWGGIGCMSGGKFISAVDGVGTALYGGDNDLALGLGGGDASEGCKKDPGWWKPKFPSDDPIVA